MSMLRSLIVAKMALSGLMVWLGLYRPEVNWLYVGIGAGLLLLCSAEYMLTPDLVSGSTK